ncbi:MAG: sensor histidine kinase [Bryobacteraceae bacterium]
MSHSPDELSRLQEEMDLANRKLAEAHKMAALGRLSAGIVHEINTPIGSIFSNNDVIIRSLDKMKDSLAGAQAAGAPPPQKVIDTLDVIIGLAAVDKIACERISGIIRSLKTFARVNESDLERVDINDLLRNMIKLTSTVFRGRIQIQTDYGELPKVECFPGLLNQVFLNLIVNAGQAIPDEGIITIRTLAEDKYVHISVADNGTGIPDAVRPKIFAAGFTTKPIGEGTGLGLTITREIVEDTHGGTIGFESEMGKGTRFDVRIPIEQSGSTGKAGQELTIG